jgi:hypothetical protein
VDRVGAKERGHVGRGGLSDIFSFLFVFSMLRGVKGDSYPELCAQRADEGGGSLLFRVSRWREGRCGFLGV